MTKLRINVHRTFISDVLVDVPGDDGVLTEAKFKALFKVVPQKELSDSIIDDGKSEIDLILVGVRDLELVDDAGEVLNPDDLLAAVKQDVFLSSACMLSYGKAIVKKSRMPNFLA